MTEQIKHKRVISPCSERLSYATAKNAVIERINLPELSGEDVRVKTLFSGISRGTESLVFAGKVPVSEHERMKCPHMAGDFSFPVSYGYACVGKIVDTGPDVTQRKIGDRVFVLHPHQSLLQISENACNPLPKAISAERAVLSANMETALNAVWDAEINTREIRCAVIGAGIVGLLTAHALNEVHHIKSTVFDIDSDKRKIVENLGLLFANPLDIKEDNDFDLIFHTTASERGLQSAVDLASFEAKIIELSWYGDKQVSLSLGGKFHSQRLKIISSQVGTIAPSHREKFSYSDRMQEAMRYLQNEKLDCLLEKPIDFASLPDHLPEIFGAGSKTLCQLVAY